VERLHLPTGRVRALISLSMVGLAVALALAGLLLSAMDAEAHPAVVTVLAATISFYFGSRSS
jgi:EamA domain-containing membrane protein RarD